MAVASERQAGSFLEQDSTEVPKFALRLFLPLRESCWGVPSPNPAYAACAAEKPLKIFFGFFKNSSASHPVFLLLVRGHHAQKGGHRPCERNTIRPTAVMW